MAVHNILVPVTGQKDCEMAIDAALILAKRFKAHVVGLHIKGNPLGKLPFFEESLALRGINREFEDLRRNVWHTEEAARSQFETSRLRHDVPIAEVPGPDPGTTASFQIVARRSANTLSEAARVFDLVVMAATRATTEEDGLQSLKGVLIDSGRPVLMTPEILPATLGDNIFLAWNRSTQSARAVAAASTFIDTASQVTIGYVGTGAKSGPAPEELARSLIWRGVEVELHHIEPEGTSVGALLLQHVEELGSDLLVMGAYSHSRVRELILGGVTQHVLRNASVPVLMVH